MRKSLSLIYYLLSVFHQDHSVNTRCDVVHCVLIISVSELTYKYTQMYRHIDMHNSLIYSLFHKADLSLTGRWQRMNKFSLNLTQFSKVQKAQSCELGSPCFTWKWPLWVLYSEAPGMVFKRTLWWGHWYTVQALGASSSLPSWCRISDTFGSSSSEW